MTSEEDLTGASAEERLIGELAGENPDAVRLAEVVSLAVLVEPQLLRRARLELLKGVDVGAESDLWLSRLVQTRSPSGMTLLPRVAERLRQRLAANPALFEKACRFTEDAHRDSPPTVTLEEKINRLSVRSDARALEEIETLLRGVANTLVHEADRGGLAHWAAGALPRLPAQVRGLGSARILAAASYLRLSAHLPPDEEASGTDLPDWLSWAIPQDLPTVGLGVQLVEDGVRLGGPAPTDHVIEVPGTNPLLVELSWPEGEGRNVQQIRLAPGERRKVAAPPVEIQLRTARGARYVIAPHEAEAEAEAAPATEEAKDERKLCFVVMGLGKKTDFESGRTLDLDKTYKNIIKPAVEGAGLRCVRADEIIHSGPIDIPMYEHLLKADVVIADLSTGNKTATYELGVRHALRRYVTLVISEDGFRRYPFDVNHVLIRQYHHQGEGIDFDEVERFRKVLGDAITEVLSRDPPETDSPVYTFLRALEPPALAAALRDVASATGAAPSAEAAPVDGPTFAKLMEDVDRALGTGDLGAAKSLLSDARWRIKTADPNKPEDPYVIQRLALATYRSKQPTPRAALEEARALLLTLSPATSNDTETLGIWGAVHKRLFEETKEVPHLDEAVRSYRRGFYLRDDYYNGINLAYLHNVRAAHAATRAEAVADFVQAERVRREVITICDERLAASDRPATSSGAAVREEREQKYWVLATKAEAYLGIGRRVEAEKYYEEAYSAAPYEWMRETTVEQRRKLEELLRDSPLKYIKADVGPGDGPTAE